MSEVDNNDTDLRSAGGSNPGVDFSGPHRLGTSASRSSTETLIKIAEIEGKISQISDPTKRDNVIVFRQHAAIFLANGLAFMWFIAHCIFEWHHQKLPIPNEFVLFIVAPYGGAVLDHLIKRLEKLKR